MKLLVASLFLVTSVTLLAAIAPAQTKHRRSAPAKPPATAKAGATLKICQGLPIPAGYIITGYMTQGACPHGAYLIKRQDIDSDSSLAANEGDSESESFVRPGNKQTTESESSAAANEKPNTESGNPVPANKKRNTSSRKSVAANRVAGQPAGTPMSASRPRRVGSDQPNTDLASLSGTETAPVPTRPTLQGMTPMGSPVNGPAGAAPDAAVDLGPEEVGEGEVIRVNTALVSVPVSVLDRQGRFVPNLRKEDFSVFENGVEQPIAYFEPADKPFTVALILDTSPSTHFHLWEIKEAAIAFAAQLRPQDRVLVVSFNEQVLLLTEATNDLNVVSSVIQQNANTGNATRLYDAVDLVIKERLNKIKGRKAIVLFTDGVDTASYLANYQSTLREVEELDALIYPIQYDTSDYMRAMQNGGSVTIVSSNSNWPFPSTSSTQTVYSGQGNGGAPMPGTTKADYERADKYLHELADKTGGRLNQANDTAQLAQAFTMIAEELRRQYSLGYYPQSPAGTGGERSQIKVKVHQPNLAVRARDSYVRASAASPAQ
ncbi:MAG: VWA domain-containing protein [Pyrinomonadaceae bacterium]